MESKSKIISGFIIGTFVTLYLMVSVISTIHVIDFFKLSNPTWLAISLAIAFEVGAAASLASLIALKKMNKGLVWMLFFLLTAMQAMGNTYYAYVNLSDFTAWSELFGIIEEDIIFQKRVLSIASGAILPIVALGFIKSLVDYIKPQEEIDQEASEEKEEPKLDVEKEPATEIAPDSEDTDEIRSGDISPEYTSLNEPLIHNFETSELITDSAPDDKEEEEEHEVREDIAELENSTELEDATYNESPQREEIKRSESEHNGRIVVEERRVLPKVVEQPSASMNPTRL